MKTLRLILIAFLIGSCVHPRLTTYEGPKIARGKGVVIGCTLNSGEIIDFGEPGGVLTERKKIFFGMNNQYDLQTIPLENTVQWFALDGTELSQPDTHIAVRKVVLKSGQSVEFIRGGARYYEHTLCINGPALNGAVIEIPVDAVRASQNLRNLAALKQQDGFLTMVGVYATIGMIFLLIKIYE